MLSDMLRCVLLITSCLLASAAEAHGTPTTTFGRPETKAERKAYEKLVVIEAELRALRLGVSDLDLQKLQPRLERLMRDCAGTKYVNKALFLLANWHLEEGDPADALPLLQSLGSSPYPHLKAAGRVTRVRCLLRLGRIQEARTISEALVGVIPEFENMLSLVAFYERIGTKPPRTAGQNLSGGPADPAAERSEPWLLYVFCDLEHDEQRNRIQRLITDTNDPAFDGALRIVIVSFNGNPLAGVNRLAQLGGKERCDLLWANPNHSGDAEAWRESWKMPSLPISVLLGPSRNIMAIDPTSKTLRPLAGLDPEAEPRGKSGIDFDWD